MPAYCKLHALPSTSERSNSIETRLIYCIKNLIRVPIQRGPTNIFMYFPQDPVDIYTPVLLDTHGAISDPFIMANNSSDHTHFYSDESQKYLRSDMPTIRRPSSSESIVTNSTCSTPLYALDMAMMRSISMGDMQDMLDTLYDEWISVDLVFRSLQNAFPVRPLVRMTHEERLEDIDRELSIAYDELMTQVRRLYRRLNKLSRDMPQIGCPPAHFLEHNNTMSDQPDEQPSRPEFQQSPSE
ncbi:hypothetical protein BJV82DRAFT_692764 [Fennellomyces sp. T-0311]|nr:hypothetical protein BJV82DRAFT_692764 [Fennellomyces sp. T-0311]